MWRDEELAVLYGEDKRRHPERVSERICAGLLPVGSEQDFRTLLRAGRITARGRGNVENSSMIIPAESWPEWAGMPADWSEDEITFDADEMRRALPYIPEAERPMKPLQTPDWYVKESARRSRLMGQLYRFRQRQRRRRQWLSFDEIADWCARIPGSVRRDEAVRAQAYADLQEAMLAGEFGHGADSRVRYFQLDPGPIKARRQLEPERLRIWLDFYGANDSVIITEIFSRCWLPRDLARRWFERRGLSWPAHFEAASESELGTGACCGDVVQEDRRAKELDKSIPANKPIRGGKTRICELGALGIPADDALDDTPAPSKPPDRGPAEARMPKSRPIHQWPTGEFKKRRLERRADIEAAIDWCLVDRAIEFVARHRDISLEGAWDAIKLDISLGKLPAQCIDDRGERVAFAPLWIELLAKFQLPTEPGTLDQPIGTVGEFSRFSDFPSGGILWFDCRRAIENRLARKITEDNRAEPSLPPIRVRDVVVDERRRDELYPEEEGLGRDRKLAEAQGADRGDPRRSRAPNGAVTVARRRGPKPGTVDRYGEPDRALFPEVERIMQEDRVTAYAAARKLASGGVEGKSVAGPGTLESRAKRLASSYLKREA